MNWGKDQGYIIRERKNGAMPGRIPRSAYPCRQMGGRCRSPRRTWVRSSDSDRRLPSARVCRGRRRVAGGERPAHNVGPANPPEYYFPSQQKGYWEYAVTRMTGEGWSAPCRRCRTARAGRARASTQPGTARASCGWHGPRIIAWRAISPPAAPAGVRGRGSAAPEPDLS